ncbi:MAG: type II toxin-antitoxin system HicB family antitoxin [bacterium]
MKQKTLKTKEYSFTVVYEPLEEGGYKITVPLLLGLVTFGRTFEEAREMVRDAIRCHVESLLKDKEKVPKETGLVQEKITLSIS